MKKVLFSVLALGAMTGAALAEPQKMDEVQMAGVAAGQVDTSNDVTQTATSAAVAILGSAMSQAYNTSNQTNNVGVSEETLDIVLPPFPNGNGGNGGDGMATSGSFDLGLGGLDLSGAGASQ